MVGFFEELWGNFAIHDRVIRGSGTSQMTCMIRYHQLQLFGYMAMFQESDPVSKVVYERDCSDGENPEGDHS